MSKTSTAKPATAAPVVVYGAASGDRPRAALFKPEQRATAEKIATALEFKVASRPLNGLADKIPAGRPSAVGREAIPPVKPALFEALLQALGDAPASATAGKGKPPAFPADPKLPEGYPLAPDWDHIEPGMLVIARERPIDGWWESVVVRVDGDILTLRYRDYTRAPIFTKHRTEIALRKFSK